MPATGGGILPMKVPREPGQVVAWWVLHILAWAVLAVSVLSLCFLLFLLLMAGVDFLAGGPISPLMLVLLLALGALPVLFVHAFFFRRHEPWVRDDLFPTLGFVVAFGLAGLLDLPLGEQGTLSGWLLPILWFLVFPAAIAAGMWWLGALLHRQAQRPE